MMRSGDPRRFVVANTAGVSGSQSDESVFSPGRSPTVLDLVESAAVAHQKNIVVQVSSAIAEDARAVSAPVSGVG